MEVVKAYPGTQVSLPCLASSEAVMWRNKDAIIFSDARFQRNFTDRFSLESEGKFYHRMIINNSQQSDSGIYQCRRGARSASVFLTVTGIIRINY
jgi:hypothetical protein